MILLALLGTFQPFDNVTKATRGLDIFSSTFLLLYFHQVNAVGCKPEYDLPRQYNLFHAISTKVLA